MGDTVGRALPWLSEVYPFDPEFHSVIVMPERGESITVRHQQAGLTFVYRNDADAPRCGAQHVDPEAVCCLPPGHDLPHVGCKSMFEGPDLRLVIESVRG